MKILCESDYEERMVFAQMAYNYNSMAQLKRLFQQVEDIDDVGIAQKIISLALYYFRFPSVKPAAFLMALLENRFCFCK